MTRLHRFVTHLLTLCMALPLAACYVPPTTIEPQTLPPGKAGEPYHAGITILSSPGPVRPESFGYTITPQDSGLAISCSTVGERLNCNSLNIQGVPRYTGDILVTIHGGTYGTMASGQHFKHTWVLRIEP